MVLPQIYRKSSLAVASYDWLDYTAGVGYKRFLGAGAIDSTGVTLFLTNKVLESATNDGSTRAIWTAGEDIDLNFDITFGVPAVVGGGDAFLTFTVSKPANTGGNAVINLYHVDLAAAETSIGTKTTRTYAVTGGGEYYRETIVIAITKKAFAIGEKLRLSITFTTDAGDSITMYHDPDTFLTFTDTASRTIGSDLKLEMPFVIEI